MDAMRVAVLGLGRGGQAVADALLASSWCELVAVAGRKSKRIEQFSEEHPRISAYDDFRSLIVENTLDALFVAIPPFLRHKYLSLAAERSIPVWMLTPAARQMDEAVALAEQFEHADCPAVVSRSWGFDPALQPDGLGVDRLGRFVFARGTVMTNPLDDMEWRGDSVRAAGGVLLDRGYPLIDTAVQLMGLPSTVYATMSVVSQPRVRPAHDTEDTAAVVCEFSGGAVAVFSACWIAALPRWSLDLCGTVGSLHIDPESVVRCDPTDEPATARQARPANPFVPQVEEFLLALGSSPAKVRSTLREHLPTIAVIEAAYLSARTGQPESPASILRMHDVPRAAPGQP